ncbi:MAG: biotin/lipoate A/B protein ligase family protein [Candidatus Goldiibacteriota bacterium]
MFVNGVRLVPYGSFSPYENMAADEYLTEYYAVSGIPVLRLYSWSPPGISIGKNQDIKTINTERCIKDGIPVVRRMTGGGAIFHKKELTYSIVCSEKDLSDKRLTVKESFEILNGFLLKMYGKFGLKAQYAKDAGIRGNAGARAPHCFSGNEEYDIIIKGKKTGGNAQCRKKGIIFQHGSIPAAGFPEQQKYFKSGLTDANFTFLEDLLGREAPPVEIEADLAAAFMETFDTDLKPQEFDMNEKKKIVKLLTVKYAANRWNIEGKTGN